VSAPAHPIPQRERGHGSQQERCTGNRAPTPCDAGALGFLMVSQRSRAAADCSHGVVTPLHIAGQEAIEEDRVRGVLQSTGERSGRPGRRRCSRPTCSGGSGPRARSWHPFPLVLPSCPPFWWPSISRGHCVTGEKVGGFAEPPDTLRYRASGTRTRERCRGRTLRTS
jgi:hypothetical protein